MFSRLTMTFTKYYAIAKTNFINSFTYIFDTLASTFFIGIVIFIFIYLWKAIYASNEIIAGFTIVMMLWYLVMTEAIVTSQSRVLQEIGEEVISGNIANYLTKPYNYLLYKYAYTIGRAILRFLLIFIVCGIIVLLMLGPLTIALYVLPFIMITAFLAITLHFLMMASFALFALWFENAQALEFIYSKIVFTIGGMLIPLELFPAWISGISMFLPFSYVAYHPAKLFVAFSFQNFIQVATMQIVWVTVFLLIAIIMYKTYIKRLQINGG